MHSHTDVGLGGDLARLLAAGPLRLRVHTGPRECPGLAARAASRDAARLVPINLNSGPSQVQ